MNFTNEQNLYLDTNIHSGTNVHLNTDLKLLDIHFTIKKPDYIFVRKEIYENEFRAPITPKDIPFYIFNSTNIIVQISKNRIFEENEYRKYGATITDLEWYETDFDEGTNLWIIGIKELNNPEEMINRKYFYTHLYFAHCYKEQPESKKLLEYFKTSGSTLYDFEYFSYNNKRQIAFGEYAGFTGCALGLIQYAIQKGMDESLFPIHGPWDSKKNLIKDCSNCSTFIIKKSKTSSERLFEQGSPTKIAIIGTGRCSRGVQNLLKIFDIDYDVFDRKSDKSILNTYNIIFNCIHLNENIPVWFDETTIFNQETVIVDISCDYSHPFNPISIYNNKTTWEEPVFYYKPNVSIIAIDNLPSLLPKESSIEFSENFKHLFKLYLQGDDEHVWENNFDIFKSKISGFDGNALEPDNENSLDNSNQIL